MSEGAIYIQGDATDTLYLNPVPTPHTSPIPPADGEDPFGVIYVSSGDLLSPNVGHPYYRKPSDGQTYDLLQGAAIAAATFITVVTEPTLPQSRRLAVTSDLSLADGGALGPMTVGLSAANIATLAKLGTASFATVLSEPGLPASRRLNASTRIAIQDNGAGFTVNIGVDAATDTLLTNLGFAPFLFAVGGQAANFPQSRNVTAGAGVMITDNGPGGTFVIAATATMLRIISSFGPGGPGSFTVPVGAVAPLLYAAAGGGGGAGGNQVGVGGPGGCGGAAIIEPVFPGDVISWTAIGFAGAGSAGGAIPGIAGNGSDTVLGVNDPNSQTLVLKGGQGGLNVYVDGSFFGRPAITPDNPVVLPGQRYSPGYNGGYPNAAGGGGGLSGAVGVPVFLRGGGGEGGTSSAGGAGGGGGGGASGTARGASGGQGANSLGPLQPALPGLAGTQGSGGGGGGGGGVALGFTPANGGDGGPGLVAVTYWILA
jgi:hypothetical protein